MDHSYSQAVMHGTTSLRTRLIASIAGLVVLIIGMVIVTRPKGNADKAKKPSEDATKGQAEKDATSKDDDEASDDTSDAAKSDVKDAPEAGTDKVKWGPMKITLTVIISVLILLTLWMIVRTARTMYIHRLASPGFTMTTMPTPSV